MSFNSYAQNFEDVMLWRALRHVQDGFYIDIGAQHPVVDSVSLAFHEHGWHGIHVEPLPQYAEQLRLQRSGDTVLQAAVAHTAEVLKFYEIADSGISTADPDIAASHRARGFKTREIVVPCVTLAAVFDMCRDKEIHWLKIDVEGYEAKVLASWGKSRARPWIVVVESTLPLSQVDTHQDWEALLLRRGYAPAYFDGLNRYYVAATHLELKAAFDAPPNVFDGFTLNGTASAPFQILIEQRSRDQLEASRAEFEARLQAAHAASQERLERAAELEQIHGELLAKIKLERADLLLETTAREARLVAHSGALTSEIEQLLRERTNRERESAELLRATEQQAASDRAEMAREWAELTRTHLAQADERQRQHLAREHSLMGELHAAHEERRSATAEIARSRALLETLTQETTDRVEAIYQRAALDREQLARAHEQRLLLAKRDSAEARSAADLHAQRLVASSDEHRLRAERLGQDLNQLGARLLAEQQSAQRLQQELAVARQEIEETRRTVSWRLTRPLRYLASTLATGK